MGKINFETSITSAEDYSSATVHIKFDSYSSALIFKCLSEHMIDGISEMFEAQNEIDEGL